MITLTIATAFAMNMVETSEVAPTLIGTFVIGILPMIGGAALFTMGISRLNQA
ncbi:MAG: hypothetical protein MZU91_06830 [Desulfosudis oleivorans]|nr:hypothetical protein [Desulfosudis oleivorans]